MSMASNLEVAELFNILESNQLNLVEEIKNLIAENFNTTREPWLVQGLFEYYLSSGSLRTQEILCGISKEPHDKFLIERLTEGIRSPPTRKLSLTFFGHLVRKQPSWLYKITISQHGLFRELIRILKTETDVVNIMTALLILITLLPIIPSYIVSNVNEIFDAFGRLAGWISQQNPNIAQEHHVHLSVALYSLFHRLYAMYPCNFLNYLRTNFGLPEKAYIFKNTLKPMLETVKIHPYLIISSRDVELNTNRWKSKEYHDIIAECSKLSLDLFETGYPEEVKAIRNSIGTLEMNPPSQPSSLPYIFAGIEKEMSGFLKDAMNANTGLNTLSNFIEDGPGTAPNTPAPFNNYNSPHPSNSSSATASLHSTLSSAVHSAMLSSPALSSSSVLHPGVPEVQPSHFSTLPAGGGKLEECTEATPECTPTTTPLREPARERFKQLGSGTSSPAVKSLAFNKSTPSTPPCTPYNSIPSSPLPKEVGKESGAGGGGGNGDSGTPQRRDSLFESNPLFRRDSLIFQRLQKVVQEQKDAENAANSGATGAVTTGRMDPKKLPSPITIPISSEVADKTDNFESGPPPQSQSYQGPPPLTPLFPLHTTQLYPDEDEMEDGITDEANAEGNPGGLHLPDHKDLIAFAKRVSRLRFYSQCTTSPGTSPSSSCSIVANQTLSISVTSTSSNAKGRVKRSISCPDIKKPIYEDEDSDPSKKIEEACKQGLPTCLEEVVQSPIPPPPEPEPQPYEHLFQELMREGREDSINSPHLLLDKCLEGAAGLHKRGSARSYEEQIILLKTQLEMLHGQLLFEKNRREAHTLRNRRLAGKCRKVQSLEEQNSSLQGAVHSLEKEVACLKKEISVQRNFSLVREKEVQELTGELENKIINLREEINSLREERADLEIRHGRTKDEYQSLLKESEQKKADLFVMDNEVKNCRKYLEYNVSLKGAYESLQKETLILGEIVRKQQQVIDNYEPHRHILAEMEDLRLTCEEEINTLRNQLEVKSSQALAALGHIQDLENELGKKDKTILAQKKLVQDTGAEYQARLMAVEDKYESVKAMNHRLELEILNLHHQLSIKAITGASRASCSGRRVNSSPSNGDFRSPSSPHNLSNHSDVDSAASASGLQGFSPDRSFIFGTPQIDSNELNDLQNIIIQDNTSVSSSHTTRSGVNNDFGTTGSGAGDKP